MADAPQPMEEILASIRRIITEKPSPLAPPPAPPRLEEDVLELGEAPPAPADAHPQPVIGPPAPSASTPPGASDGLLSGPSEAQSRQALAALATLSIDPSAPANTLDGMVREMLRPLLKDWLDRNLPDLVERIVAREIARLGR